jgi:hypothetical protein
VVSTPDSESFLLSLPGLTRQSMVQRRFGLGPRMDARLKAGHDTEYRMESAEA